MGNDNRKKFNLKKNASLFALLLCTSLLIFSFYSPSADQRFNRSEEQKETNTKWRRIKVFLVA